MRGHFAGDCENLHEHNAHFGSPLLLSGRTTQEILFEKIPYCGANHALVTCSYNLALIMLGYFGERKKRVKLLQSWLVLITLHNKRP